MSKVKPQKYLLVSEKWTLVGLAKSSLNSDSMLFFILHLFPRGLGVWPLSLSRITVPLCSGTCPTRNLRIWYCPPYRSPYLGVQRMLLKVGHHQTGWWEGDGFPGTLRLWSLAAEAVGVEWSIYSLFTLLGPWEGDQGPFWEYVEGHEPFC